MLQSLFTVQRAEIVVRPRSRAYGTLFWFVTGHNPAAIICAVEGSVTHYCKVAGFWVSGRARISRKGNSL